MGKTDLLREMDLAWTEASECAATVENILEEQREGKSTPDLDTKLERAKRQHSEALQRYRGALSDYHDIAVMGSARRAP